MANPNIVDVVSSAAATLPDADSPALIVRANRTPINYRALLALVDDLAGQLLAGGLRAGDRAAIRTYSSVEFVVGLLAAVRVGVIAVPLDPALPVAEQRARLAAAGARVVLVDAVDPADEQSPSWLIAVSVNQDGVASVDLDSAAALLPAASTPAGLRADDALIMFTGGTTGPPKMVPWTHENICRSTQNVIASYPLGPQDATVAVMPLYHGHGLIAALLGTLASGGRLLLPAGGRFSAQSFWDDVRAADATWYTAVPTIHQILLQRAAADYRGHQLRFIRSCSAALSPEAAHDLLARFGAPVLCAYGMTEATHQISSMGLGADDGALSPGDVGRPTGVQVRIVEGEVWVRGSTVVRGYLGNQSATDQNFTDGWLRTGDLGSLSAQGDLALRGRIKEMINRAGEKISPERVEGVLASHPKVLEAAVFGLPDAVYGETVAAVIVAGSAGVPTLAELVEFGRDRLAAFELPTTLYETNELPHTAKGSLDRRAVEQRFGHPG